MQPDFFVCPRCLGHLTAQPNALVCPSCAATFPQEYGVPNFSAATDYYYGEFPQPLMRSIVETAAREGSARAFDDALRDKTEDWRQYFLHYATDETRAAWQFLLRLPENATVLDMGCGWGNLAISLARNFATVYAMDLVPERAAFSAIRAREAGLQNVRALAGGNTGHLPFPDSCMDAVALNGVLEWVATSFPQIADPREAQVQVLREVARVLKPDGQVYIGIENRLGFLYFLGRPDEHSKLKFTTLLPRWLANRYSQARRQQPYRTYTHSWRGYRKLLREAGLTDTRFYCPFPEYREFSELVALDRPQNLARALHPTSAFGRLGLQVCKRVNLLREFSPSYSIVAGKTRGPEGFVNRLLRHVRIDDAEEFYLHVTRTGAALLFTPNVLVRLPLTARAHMRMNVEAANLRKIWSAQLPLVPQPISEGEFQRQPYFATPVFRGVSGTKLMRRTQNQASILRQAAEFITNFHHATRREQICTEEWLQKNFDWLVDYVCALGKDVSELKRLCRRDLLGKRVLNVTAHGDFSLKNLVFDPQACKLTGVVDWDLTDFDGWPARDLVNLLVVLQYESHSDTFNEAALTVLKRLRDNDGVERELLNSYLAALEVGPEQVVWSLQRYLLRVVHDKHTYGDGKTAPLLAALDTQLAAARLLTREWLTGVPGGQTPSSRSG
jgi:ubiquinone/menaquinone biosynthesis C-methylase UbiE/aminoglycoside phosphotransferase (APT) family kinase protein